MKKKNKTWFSRTYSPKYRNWMNEEPGKTEVDFGLTESNSLYFSEKSLELPPSASPLVEEPLPRRGWRESGKPYVGFTSPSCCLFVFAVHFAPYLTGLSSMMLI